MRTPASSNRATYVGLAIALFGMPVVVLGQKLVFGPVQDLSGLLVREGLLFGLLALLWLVIRNGERLSPASIGLSASRPGKTLLLSVMLFMLLGVGTAAALALLSISGLQYGGQAKYSPPVLAMLLVVFRAGIIEEIFYRGYAIERLQSLTGSKAVAAVVPLLCFAVAHASGGLAGVLISLILGAILTWFYMWRRNLVANILGHFLIDFVPNIVLPLLGG